MIGFIGASACNNDFGCTGSTGEFVALWGGVGAGIGLVVDAMTSRQAGTGLTRDPPGAPLPRDSTP